MKSNVVNLSNYKSKKAKKVNVNPRNEYLEKTIERYENENEAQQKFKNIFSLIAGVLVIVVYVFMLKEPDQANVMIFLLSYAFVFGILFLLRAHEQKTVKALDLFYDNLAENDHRKTKKQARTTCQVINITDVILNKEIK